MAYHEAVARGEGEAFADALHAEHAVAGDNQLLAAWHYRLRHAAAGAQRRSVAWAWAVPLALAAGFVFWLVSDDERFKIAITNPFDASTRTASTPLFVLLGAPLAAIAIVAFLSGAGERRWRRALAVTAPLAGAVLYVLWAYPQVGTRVYQDQYIGVSTLSLLLLSWAAIGAFALKDARGVDDRFAFLLKSLEYVVVAGLCGIIVALFTGLTFGLFDAMDLFPSNEIQRLFYAGGAGFVAVLAAALTIEPGVPPRGQRLDAGPGRLVTLFLRLLLPITLLVLVVFLGFLPANARAPFENRDVLVAFNAMLFAVMALLIGVTPRDAADLDARQRTWLRRGVIALATLALVVGLYALAAIGYRTVQDRLTPNRLVFLGWTTINLALLARLLWLQRCAEADAWLPALRRALADGLAPYALWAALTLLALPWLFGIDEAEVADLPPQIQRVVFERPAPILLKCPSRPEVYLLDAGRKRWIVDIPTFQAEGFDWSDVKLEACAVIDAVPDGRPIPPDAGFPPAP